MGEHFVDDNVWNEQVVALFRAGGSDEQDDVGRAIGQAALGDALELRAEDHLIDESSEAVGNAQGLAAFREGKRNVVRACAEVVVGDDLQEARQSGSDVGARGNWRVLKPVVEVVGEVQAAQFDGLRAGIVNLKPISGTAARIGHPLVNLQQAGIAERGGDVGRALRRHVQHPTAAAIGDAADGPVGRLDAEGDRVEQFAAALRTVEQVKRIARGFHAEAGVEHCGKVRRGRRFGVEAHHAVAIRRDDRPCREHPAARCGELIRQAHAREIDLAVRRVVEFDPIADRAVGVGAVARIGQHFVDLDASLRWVVGDHQSLQTQGEENIRCGSGTLMHLHRQNVVPDSETRQIQRRCLETAGLGVLRSRTVMRDHSRRRRHVVSASFGSIHVVHRSVVGEVNRLQGGYIHACRKGEVNAEVVAKLGRTHGQRRPDGFERSQIGIEAKRRLSTQPACIIE